MRKSIPEVGYFNSTSCKIVFFHNSHKIGTCNATALGRKALFDITDILSGSLACETMFFLTC